MKFFKKKKRTNSHTLKVIDVKQTTPNAVIISLEVSNELKGVFHFLPGQYINVQKKINNNDVKRAYSICTSPSDSILKIGVKRIKDGLFSEYANNQLKVGDTLKVTPPEGKFILKNNQPKHIMAFASGSGITPIMSILKSLLETSSTYFTLIYGNKSPKETMFWDELKSLENNFQNRLKIIWTYSQANESDAHSGRIDKEKVIFALKKISTPINQIFICGPESMVNIVSNTLQDNNISKDSISYELFTSSITENQPLESSNNSDCKITIIHDDETHSIMLSKEKSILEAIIKNNINVPFSCQGGVCSSCIAKITNGKATMSANHVLTDNEIEEGLILTCQARPQTSKITVNYDEA